MTNETLAGGTYTLADGLTVSRLGYGAMQLAGPGVFGPPADREGAVAVLREAVDLGINHIDTSDYYGPHVTNQIIKEAYFPLGGFNPLQSDVLDKVAARLSATPMAVALAWLLQRAPNILLIPGTSSVAHLRENVSGAALELPADALADLNAIAS
jgi:aryl-alcohol dehydrogenase-like predicted oxidoreductase